MSGKVLGYYGRPRVFHCAACGTDGLTGFVEVALVEGGLDYASEQCDACDAWVDESGENDEA